MDVKSFLDSLSPRLSAVASAELVPGRSASVALVFRGARDAEEILLITRAERRGDPWSGQVAFPGGMVDVGDRSFEETARRETAEEVGLQLSGGRASFRGYLREFRTHARNISVVPSVFRLIASQETRPNAEVASCQWASLSELAEEAKRPAYMPPGRPGEAPFSCIRHGGLVIWGQTERVLSVVLSARGAGSDPER